VDWWISQFNVWHLAHLLFMWKKTRSSAGSVGAWGIAVPVALPMRRRRRWTASLAPWSVFFATVFVKVCWGLGNSHRIHGAGIYANMTGVYSWDPCDHI
jgi:hypothetical protein